MPTGHPRPSLDFNGERLTVAQWATRVGLRASTLRTRLGDGWSIQDTLTTPVFQRRSRKIVVNQEERIAWHRMRRRCRSLNPRDYKYYRGRGITVCERWANSFENFLADMGSAPPGQRSVERINNDLGYTPENCKWASMKEQANNRRKREHFYRAGNFWIEFNGQTKILVEWARELGINSVTLRHRLVDLAWPPERALTTPARPMKAYARVRKEAR